MPLNISIDVDGTILDENEGLVPHTRESIQRLKDAGHYVQLWSGGGAEYAEKIARKFSFAHLIDSYAKKADVAIDDLPETAHPATVIHVDQQHRLDQAVQKVFQTEQNVDSAVTLSSRMLRYIQQLRTEKPAIVVKYRVVC